MHDLFTREEDAAALKQGWGLHHVYDMASSKWRVQILPVKRVPAVINSARIGDKLCLRALHLIAHPPAPKGRPNAKTTAR